MHGQVLQRVVVASQRDNFLFIRLHQQYSSCQPHFLINWTLLDQEEHWNRINLPLLPKNYEIYAHLDQSLAYEIHRVPQRRQRLPRYYLLWRVHYHGFEEQKYKEKRKGQQGQEQGGETEMGAYHRQRRRLVSDSAWERVQPSKQRAIKERQTEPAFQKHGSVQIEQVSDLWVLCILTILLKLVSVRCIGIWLIEIKRIWW